MTTINDLIDSARRKGDVCAKNGNLLKAAMYEAMCDAFIPSVRLLSDYEATDAWKGAAYKAGQIMEDKLKEFVREVARDRRF